MPERQHILLVDDDTNDADFISVGLAENNLANRVVTVREHQTDGVRSCNISLCRRENLRFLVVIISAYTPRNS